MAKVYYNKLVRDGIQKKIEDKGESCEVREIVDDAELQQELFKKVMEEASALARVRNRHDFLKEYADLIIVLDALTAQLGFSEADIKVAIEDNVAEKGFYNKRHFLHWSADEDYRSNESPQGIKE